MTYEYCAQGVEADCSGPELYDSPAPSCADEYVPSYADGRYEGCSFKVLCAEPFCPGSPPTAGAPCGVDERTCYYEDCHATYTTGRTLAICDHGVWAVDTGPCGSVSCEGNEAYGKTYAKCKPGEFCVYTKDKPGWITAECLTNGCYGRAVTRECIDALPGPSRVKCTIDYSVTGTTLKCDELPAY